MNIAKGSVLTLRGWGSILANYVNVMHAEYLFFLHAANGLFVISENANEEVGNVKQNTTHQSWNRLIGGYFKLGNTLVIVGPIAVKRFK